MAIRTELNLRLTNSPGSLQRVCDILGEARVNLTALHLESGGTLRLLVDNPLQAAGMLAEHGHAVAERDVIYAVVPNSPGALASLARLLAEAGVNLDFAYASADEGSPTAAIILGVGDVQRAAAASGL
jgi:hypothetical protein